MSPSSLSPDLPAPLWAWPGSLLSLYEVEKVAPGSYNSTLSDSVTQQASTSHLAANGEIKSQGKTDPGHMPTLADVVMPGPGPLTTTAVVRASQTSSTCVLLPHSLLQHRSP